MSLLPENVLIVYRDGDSDSYAFAQYYAAAHNIADSQLLPVPCSTSESLGSYDDFVEQIEADVFDYVNSEYGSAIKCIVVSYGVPGSFYDDTENIYVSTTSRLSNIFETYQYGKDNPLYNRRQYADYTLEDAISALVTARFDAPTLEIAKAHVDRCQAVDRTGYANGRFMFDKVALLNSGEKTNYYNDLEDFEETTLTLLNMPTTKTVADTVNDVPLFRLKNDSFVWAWASDRAGYSYFQEHRYARIFCYNADLDGASRVRDEEERVWPMLAISSGYATCAGTVDAIGYDEMLRPKPFFEALLRGASIGEAYLYANPKLDSSMTLFGDPLIRVRFPTGETLDNSVSEVEGFQKISEYFADAVAYSIRKRTAFKTINEIVQASADFDTKVELFTPSVTALTAVAATTISVFRDAAEALVSFPSYNVNDFVADNGIKLSRLIRVMSNKIADSNIAQTGSWFVETPIVRAVFGYDFYHFVLEVSFTPHFEEVFAVIDSRDSDGWTYEKNPDEFIEVPEIGVTSSYAGRRVRYESPDTMEVGAIYYARIKQVNSLEESTAWVSQSRIINT